MKKMLLSVCTLMICMITLSAQQHVCGTSLEAQYEMRERLIRNRANTAGQEVAGERAVKYVPVQFHLVGRGDGSSAVSENTILNALCVLNNSYADQDIQFYFKMPFNYIYNDGLYFNAGDTDGGPGGGPFQIQGNKVDDALNIFVVGSFYNEPNLGGYYQPPFPLNDYVVVRKSSITDFVLPHEIGHFFSLPHPFYGWEDNPWDPSVHGMQVGTNAPSMSNSLPPGVVFPNEKVDQSNCATAADAICDTPPDYLFAFSTVQNGCNTFTGGAMDPNGDLIDPMENNYMSYFAPCASYTFTPDQKAAILADIESPQRNYINSNYIPELGEVTETPNLVKPINGETTPAYNYVEFDWDDVPNADHYVLEIDFIPTFLGAPTRYIVSNGSFKVVEDIFNQSATYYWRVRPFGQYFTCGTPLSASGNFQTGSVVSTNNIEAISGWSVRPNPVSSGQTLNVEVDAASSFDGEISMYNTAGQLVKSVGTYDFVTGVSNIGINVSGISAGIYFVTIQTDSGVMNKKVVVTK